MNILTKGAAKRLIFSLLLAVSLGGCAYYGPPPSGYDSYPYSYGYPSYVGPPVSIDLGFGFYDYGRVHHSRGHRTHHGYHGGYRGGHHGQRGSRHAGRGQRRGWR